MEIAGISDFESLAASTNAPVFTPQTDDFGLAVHIFKMLNRGIHPYASGELDLDIFDLDDDDIPPAPSINSCVCNGRSPFVGTLVGYVVPKYALELDDFSGLMGEALRRSQPGHRRRIYRLYVRRRHAGLACAPPHGLSPRQPKPISQDELTGRALLDNRDIHSAKRGANDHAGTQPSRIDTGQAGAPMCVRQDAPPPCHTAIDGVPRP